MVFKMRREHNKEIYSNSTSSSVVLAPKQNAAVDDESKETCDIVDLKSKAFYLREGPQYFTEGPGK